jgi:hypothetical protein
MTWIFEGRREVKGGAETDGGRWVGISEPVLLWIVSSQEVPREVT